MTEKDLDVAIEKCERIMECDTRTLKNPVSENGWIFEKVYDLLKFLRQCQFDSDTNAQPKWIPVTERPPEKEGRYVCTYTYNGKKDVFMFRFEDGDFLVPWYVDAITAWYKPLDPWEGEEHGET